MSTYQTIDQRLIPQKQYTTPTTGSTVTVNGNGYVSLFLNPVGSLVALTVTFPAGPTDQDCLDIHSSQVITTLTMNGGTIVGALTTAIIGTFASYRYYSDSSNWVRIG